MTRLHRLLLLMLYHFPEFKSDHQSFTSLLKMVAVGLVINISLVSCQPTSDGQQSKNTGKSKGTPFLPERVVSVSEAKRGTIASYYSATSTLEVEKEAEIQAQVEGIVEEILVEEGSVVKQGAPLLKIKNPEYEYLLRKSKAQRINLEAQFKRLETVFEKKIISPEEFDKARNDLEVAKSDEGLAQLKVDYLTVKALIAGKVTHRHIDVGNRVSVGVPLFAIADFDPLIARVHIPAKEFRKIQTEQDVRMRLDSTGEKLEGKIYLVAPTINPKTGTIKVTVEVHSYPEATRPGDFVQVDIVTERRENSLLVDQRAVFLDRGEQVVYLATEDNKAERRVVEVGFTDEEHKEILSGLKVGERVIVRGQRSLKPGSPLKIKESPISKPNVPQVSKDLSAR